MLQTKVYQVNHLINSTKVLNLNYPSSHCGAFDFFTLISFHFNQQIKIKKNIFGYFLKLS